RSLEWSTPRLRLPPDVPPPTPPPAYPDLLDHPPPRSLPPPPESEPDRPCYFSFSAFLNAPMPLAALPTTACAPPNADPADVPLEAEPLANCGPQRLAVRHASMVDHDQTAKRAHSGTRRAAPGSAYGSVGAARPASQLRPGRVRDRSVPSSS